MHNYRMWINKQCRSGWQMWAGWAVTTEHVNQRQLPAIKQWQTNCATALSVSGNCRSSFHSCLSASGPERGGRTTPQPAECCRPPYKFVLFVSLFKLDGSRKIQKDLESVSSARLPLISKSEFWQFDKGTPPACFSEKEKRKRKKSEPSL